VCVFISAGTCLPNRCLAMNVSSGSAIPAFTLQVTVYTDRWTGGWRHQYTWANVRRNIYIILHITRLPVL
jgi:hypothetical protein